MDSKIAILNPGYGNIHSIYNMLYRLGISAQIISSTEEIKDLHKIILPGVGAFDYCMGSYQRLEFCEAIRDHIKQGKPLLGICAGAQILGQSSEEGQLDGLNILPFKNIKFKLINKLPIPHMGWNKLNLVNENHYIFKNLDAKHRFYFVHSFHFDVQDESIVLSTTDYGYTFPSILAKDNVIAIQFHPEKSQKYGMKILSNFASNDD